MRQQLIGNTDAGIAPRDAGRENIGSGFVRQRRGVRMNAARQSIQQAIRNAQPFLRSSRETEIERKTELAAAAVLVREAVPAAVIGGRDDLANQLAAIAFKLEVAAR